MRNSVLAAACAAAVVGLAACGDSSSDGGNGGGADGRPAAAPAASSPAPASPSASPSRSASALSGLSAREIADRASRATTGADSVTVDFDGVLDGSPTKLHLALDREGECAGEMTMGEGRAEIVKTGGTAYMKFDEPMWRSVGSTPEEAATMQELIGDRWFSAPASGSDGSDLTAMCDLKELLSGFGESGTSAAKGEESEVGGVPVISLVEKDGAETTTGYVATEGEPYVMRIVSAGGDEPVTVTFADYGKPVAAQAPPAADVIDLAELGG
ncbi:hypothetical protein [Streptomyces capparidis]